MYVWYTEVKYGYTGVLYGILRSCTYSLPRYCMGILRCVTYGYAVVTILYTCNNV